MRLTIDLPDKMIELVDKIATSEYRDRKKQIEVIIINYLQKENQMPSKTLDKITNNIEAKKLLKQL